ncbi:fasciclin domain-containing protein [Stenotrophomonas bentonitica]|uniref:fasciclin domain-containing protein n=1 Tax=Stenotrophomonas bentonitica TaxID=1450134 RepID=UPI0008A2289A|nr:fasciclin [Stenotrophomonas sp. HMSC10F06]
MKIQFAGLVLIGCLAAAASPLVFAQAPAPMMGAQHSNPKVGGAAMYANKDIIDNAVNSKDHTTLVAAVKAAGLVDTLKGPGPFTVFAPTNAAFSALPKGTVEGLLKPEKKADLTRILTYHVVPGAVTSTDLMAKIKQGGGKASLTTVEGEALTARVAGKGITLTDSKGQVAQVTIADVKQSNGVIHVIDKVLMP